MTNKDNGGPASDRELLEMAAKAAGIKIDRESDSGSGLVDSDDFYWNPLSSDGDALRLAVALGVIVDCRYGDKSGSHNVYVNYWPKGYTGVYLSVCEASADQLSATRRAIVRAAAAIGSAM